MPLKTRVVLAAAASLLLALAACTRSDVQTAGTPAAPPAAARPATVPTASPTLAIVAAARSQIGKTLTYDSAYTKLAYPGGDVPLDRGVCTDVVIRALRAGIRWDLQQLVHDDMARDFAKYPQQWGLTKPDSNIDHRRVPNLRTYFERQGYSLTATTRKEDYFPGDLVTCTVSGKLPHIMIVSDRRAPDGTPLVIHNIGAGTQEEPRLFDFPLTGHYRLKFGA
jgi:uncharacterized protein